MNNLAEQVCKCFIWMTNLRTIHWEILPNCFLRRQTIKVEAFFSIVTRLRTTQLKTNQHQKNLRFTCASCISSYHISKNNRSPITPFFAYIYWGCHSSSCNSTMFELFQQLYQNIIKGPIGVVTDLGKRGSHRAQWVWLVNSTCRFTSVVQIYSWPACQKLWLMNLKFCGLSELSPWRHTFDLKKITVLQVTSISTLIGLKLGPLACRQMIILMGHHHTTDCGWVGGLHMPVA